MCGKREKNVKIEKRLNYIKKRLGKTIKKHKLEKGEN